MSAAAGLVVIFLSYSASLLDYILTRAVGMFFSRFTTQPMYSSLFT